MRRDGARRPPLGGAARPGRVGPPSRGAAPWRSWRTPRTSSLLPACAAALTSVLLVAAAWSGIRSAAWAGASALRQGAAGTSVRPVSRTSRAAVAAQEKAPAEKKKQKEANKKKASGGAAGDIKITPRDEDYNVWYTDVIEAADLMDDAPVRGCKILRPNGFGLWENMQRLVDPKFRKLGVQNAYFPLLIPVSFLSKEAAHVEGFAKECAVVTHHRLRATTDAANAAGVEVDPESELAEPYVVRPTSETVVWDAFGRWIRSYRDLPLKMNQWVNVMRWEHRTKPFLRSAEFLWQEGHTAHATRVEANQQARDILSLYIEVAQDHLALPLFPGRKSDRERFAGADETYTIEALAQNGMAIQAGTSHFLGQNFAKAFDVTYQTAEQTEEHVWATSWGVSTRLLGAVIMAHSDDSGLVLPPVLAATQVVVVPLASKDAEVQARILEAAEALRSAVEEAGHRVHLDSRTELKPGVKYYEWERKGVPVRLELGARDLEAGSAMAKLRTGGDKFQISLGDAGQAVTAALESVRQALLERSRALKERLTFRIGSRADLDARLASGTPGMMLVPWGGDDTDEEKLQEDTGVTLRCYPIEQDPMPDGQVCPLTGKPSRIWAAFAKAY